MRPRKQEDCAFPGRGEKVVFRPGGVSDTIRRVLRQDASAFKNTAV
jgi:hypothetical protein